MADNDGDSDEARTLRPLQTAAWPCRPRLAGGQAPRQAKTLRLDCLCLGSAYRIAFGPRAGQKVLTLQGAMPRQTEFKQTLCADIDGFSLHAAVHCGADDRQALEQLCRYIPRPALANERVQTNAAGQVVLRLKTPWRDGTTHLVISPLEFMQRLAEANCAHHRPMRLSWASLAGHAGPEARPLARHKQSTGLFVSGLGCSSACSRSTWSTARTAAAS